MAKVSKAELGKCVGPGCGRPARMERQERREARKAMRSPKFKDGGKSFPDLNKDGKITKADILKGRGVIKNGGKLKKAKSGATLSPSKNSVSSELGGYKKVIGKNYGKAKAGASVKKKAMGGMKMMKGGGKCKYGC